MKFKIHGGERLCSNSGIEFAKYGGNTSCFEIETIKFKYFATRGPGFVQQSFCVMKRDVPYFLLIFTMTISKVFLSNPDLFSTGRQISVSSAL